MNLSRTILARFRRAFQRHLDERRERRAFATAVHRFAQLHPSWHNALFDATFLDRFPKGMVRRLATHDLARAWTRQFRYDDERRRERDVRWVRPIAESFLALLAEAEAEKGLDPRRGPVACPRLPLSVLLPHHALAAPRATEPRSPATAQDQPGAPRAP